jgi:hypothetical protein
VSNVLGLVVEFDIKDCILAPTFKDVIRKEEEEGRL